MTLAQFLIIMRARWKAALLIFGLTVGCAVGIGFMLPNQYTATATLLVDQYRPDVVGATAYAGSPSPVHMATQLDVLKSDRVAHIVVQRLGLAKDPELREAWMRDAQGVGSFDAWLVARLQPALEIKPPRDSNVISVNFRATDPARAAAVANQFAQAFLDVTRELRVDPSKQNTTLFATRAKDLRAELERVQAKLTAYQRENGVVVATEGQIDVETARLNELSTQLVTLQALAADSSSRRAQVPESGERLQEVVNNPLLINLRSDVAKAEARLLELNSRLGDNHPQVVEARATIAGLRTRMDAETGRVTGSVGVTDTINRARAADTRAALEEQRSRVVRMRTVREAGMVMSREVDAAQRAYDAILLRLNQTGLESQATQGGAYLLSGAEPPPLPSSPNHLRIAVLSLVIGTIFAVGMAIVFEYLDRRVRTSGELSEALGLPLLGVLPSPGGVSFAGLRAPLLAARAAFLRLPSPKERA